MKSPRNSFHHLAAFLVTTLCLSSLAGTAAPTERPTGSDTNIWDVFKQRRSVRKFRPDAIPDADIKKMIDAARLAPTSGNQQPWRFLVVRDRNKINQMQEACVKGALERFDQRGGKPDAREEFEKGVRSRMSGYFSAPAYIVILTDNNSRYPDYNHWDGPMAAGYLMLAARALGYGTVFITDSIPDSVTKEVLHIPDTYTRVCITPVGIPVEWPDSPPKKGVEALIAFEAL
jgi:nitroreductase